MNLQWLDLINRVIIINLHHCDVKRASWHLKSPATKIWLIEHDNAMYGVLSSGVLSLPGYGPTNSDKNSGMYWPRHGPFNTLRPRQHGRHFADDTFKRISLNENLWVSIKIALKFVPKSPIDNIPALFQIMAWRRPGVGATNAILG